MVVRRAGGLAGSPPFCWRGLLRLIDHFDMFKSNFLMIWIALGVGLAYVAFRSPGACSST